MKISATLYISNTPEAVEVYKEAFGLDLGYHEKYADGTYMHASLLRDGQEIFAVSESQNDSLVNIMLASTLAEARPIMCYGINFKNEKEVKKAFSLLEVGGKVLLPLGSLPWSSCCGEVVDKYGVYWYLYL